MPKIYYLKPLQNSVLSFFPCCPPRLSTSPCSCLGKEEQAGGPLDWLCKMLPESRVSVCMSSSSHVAAAGNKHEVRAETMSISRDDGKSPGPWEHCWAAQATMNCTEHPPYFFWVIIYAFLKKSSKRRNKPTQVSMCPGRRSHNGGRMRKGTPSWRHVHGVQYMERVLILLTGRYYIWLP